MPAPRIARTHPPTASKPGPPRDNPARVRCRLSTRSMA
jgi:hypothetical protein